MTVNVITTTAEGEQSEKNSKNCEGSFPLSARPLWGRCHFWALSVSPCLSAGSAGRFSQHLPAASAQALRATLTHALGRSRRRQEAPGLTAAKSLDLAPTQLPPDLLVLFVKRFLRDSCGCGRVARLTRACFWICCQPKPRGSLTSKQGWPLK